MAVVPPVVRHMILCEEGNERLSEPGKVDLLGLISNITSMESPAYPLLYPQLCIFVQLTNGRGSATLAIRIRMEETDQVISGSPPHQGHFANDPLAVRGLFFRLQGVRFPGPGLYAVEFVVDGKPIAREPLLLR